LLTVGAEGVRLWEMPAGKRLAHRPPEAGVEVLYACFGKNDHAHLVIAKPAKTLPNQQAPAAWTVEVRDVVSNERIVPPLEHENKIERAILSSDGSKLVTLALKHVAADKKSPDFEWIVRTWDLRDGRAIGPPLKPGKWITQFAVSPDGAQVITYRPSPSGAPVVALGMADSGQEEEAQLWHTSTGTMFPLKHAGVVTHAAFSPDGTHIVTASADRTARIWDLQGRPVSPPLEHRARINHAALGRNGLIVTASNDHTARVWHVATGEPVSPPLHHAGPVVQAAFSPDGQRLVTSDLFGTSRVWDLSPDVRDAEYTKKLAQLLACHRIDPTGGLTVLDGPSLEQLWKELRQRRPEDFAVAPRQALAWHEAQAWDRTGRKIANLFSQVPALHSFEGRLTVDDPLDSFPLTQKSYCKVEKVDLDADKVYQIDLHGEFDTYLRVEDSAKKTLMHNDDAGPPTNLNSRLLFAPPRKDAYRLLVTSFNERETGAYTLQLREAEKAGEPTIVQEKLAKTDKNNQGRFFKSHPVKLSAGRPYKIELQSREFDTLLVLIGPAEKTLTDNNGMATGNSRASRIDFTPELDGMFTLIATSVNPGELGAYTLTVQGFELRKKHDGK